MELRSWKSFAPFIVVIALLLIFLVVRTAPRPRYEDPVENNWVNTWVTGHEDCDANVTQDFDPTQKLHDGENPVTKISVMGIFRDCAGYLPFMFKALDEMARAYPSIEFSYYLLENDSSDESRELLDKWIADKKGRMFGYDSEAKRASLTDVSFARTKKLAMIRNSLLTSARDDLDSEYTILLDSDVYFDPSIIRTFFEARPATNGYAMMCAYTQQLFGTSGAQIANIDRESYDGSKLIDAGHFYDTYSFVDMDGQIHYPQCAFERCSMCNVKSQINKIPKEQSVVPVRSCFGGLVVIETGVLKNPNVVWDTVNVTPLARCAAEASLCEHVIFCDRVRTSTGRQIVLLQDANKSYRTF